MSRNEKLPANINDPETRKGIIASWTRENILKDTNNSFQYGSIPTISSTSIAVIARILGEFFEKHLPDSYTVLELFAGNCLGSKKIYSSIDTKCNWICTDVIKYSAEEMPRGMSFDELHSVAAVAKYGKLASVLLMLAPSPPSPLARENKGYADYYSCKDFIDQTLSEGTSSGGRHKYIIFVGELGASDGSPGMYIYLIENPNLSLQYRMLISKSTDIFGDPCKKELFIFKIK